jgi:hypothetical protein
MAALGCPSVQSKKRTERDMDGVACAYSRAWPLIPVSSLRKESPKGSGDVEPAEVNAFHKHACAPDCGQHPRQAAELGWAASGKLLVLHTDHCGGQCKGIAIAQ